MKHNRSAFALVELAMILVVVILFALLIAPMMKQRWNVDGLSQSLENVRGLNMACAQYRADHAGYIPMRGCGYSNGQITGGWDTWNFAGKNCSAFWASGAFDETAFSRFLNPYIAAPIPQPPGYVNTGSGATWTFNDGTPPANLRGKPEIKYCRSPGDIATRQRTWPVATPGVSCYDDVGTSYHLNMLWWSQPGGPAGFTAKYNAGSEAIRRDRGAIGKRPASNFVWISDQIGTIAASSTGTTPGEFGGNNMSVLGFLDGRAQYVALVPGAMSGPGYTFGITWP